MIKNKRMHLALFATFLSTTTFATDIPAGTRVTITVTKDGTIVPSPMPILVENNDSVLPTTTTTQVVHTLEQILFPEELWTAHFNENFESIRKEALDQTVKPTDLFKRKILETPEVDIYWPLALENFKCVMHINPLPSIEEWPMKGIPDGYNRILLKQVSNLIAKQKAAWLTAHTQG